MTIRVAVLSLFVLTQFLVWTKNIAEAQRAEPLRIEFKPGSHVAVLNGTLQGRQQMEYVAEVQNGQSVTLTPGSHSWDELKLQLRSPQNMDIALSDTGSHRWTATVTESGDYEIRVARSRNPPGKISYTLRVAIQ